MALHFQVYADFKFINGKQQFVSTSISSTKAACSLWVFNPFEHKPLTISRILPSLEQAKSYIVYLHGRYPDSPAKPPVLDGNQQDLFQEFSK